MRAEDVRLAEEGVAAAQDGQRLGRVPESLERVDEPRGVWRGFRRPKQAAPDDAQAQPR